MLEDQLSGPEVSAQRGSDCQAPRIGFGAGETTRMRVHREVRAPMQVHAGEFLSSLSISPEEGVLQPASSGPRPAPLTLYPSPARPQPGPVPSSDWFSEIILHDLYRLWVPQTLPMSYEVARTWVSAGKRDTARDNRP